MRSTWRSLSITVFLAATLLNTAYCYTITVDAHAEECFFENVEADTKMGKTNIIIIYFSDNTTKHYSITCPFHLFICY